MQDTRLWVKHGRVGHACYASCQSSVALPAKSSIPDCWDLAEWPVRLAQKGAPATSISHLGTDVFPCVLSSTCNSLRYYATQSFHGADFVHLENLCTVGVQKTSQVIALDLHSESFLDYMKANSYKKGCCTSRPPQGHLHTG